MGCIGVSAPQKSGICFQLKQHFLGHNPRAPDENMIWRPEAEEMLAAMHTVHAKFTQGLFFWCVVGLRYVCVLLREQNKHKSARVYFPKS
jgi:hypothetical protein